MRVLVIGDSNSIFIKTFIEKSLIPLNAEVVLVREGYLNESYISDYKRNNVILEAFDHSKLVNRIPVIRSIFGIYLWSLQLKEKYGYFDVIHVHGLNRSRGNLALYLKNITKKIIISVWGDELLKSSDKRLKVYRKYYDLCTYITVATQKMQSEFMKRYNHIYDTRISINRFGLPVFDYIDYIKRTENVTEARRKLGIEPNEKLIVLVGHNGRSAQRHIELTKVIASLPEESQKCITAIYPMTYGVQNEDYLVRMNKEIEKLKCTHVILTEYMNEEVVSRLRSITNILLHAQLTDAFSAAVQESIYSGAIVFNGSWLRYGELDERNVNLIEYDNFDQLRIILNDVIMHYDNYSNQIQDNKKILREISSPEATAKAWQALYE